MWQLLLALATLGQAGGLSTLSTEQLIARIPELPNKDYWKEDPFGECEFAPLWPSISAKRYSYSPEPREADPLIKEILRRGASPSSRERAGPGTMGTHDARSSDE